MIVYRIEKLSDDGTAYTEMVEASEAGIKEVHGDTEGAKIIAGEHDKWHLTETYEVPDPPSEAS